MDRHAFSSPESPNSYSEELAIYKHHRLFFDTYDEFLV